MAEYRKINAQRKDLARLGSPDLRKRLDALLAAEDRLLIATAPRLVATADVIAAMKCLDGQTIEALKAEPGLEVYRRWVASKSESSNRIGQELARRQSRRTRSLIMGDASLWTFSFGLLLTAVPAYFVFLAVSVSASFCGLTIPNDLRGWAPTYFITALILILIEVKARFPKVTGKLKALESELAAIDAAYRDRQRIATSIKQAENYLKARQEREIGEARLKELREDVVQIEAVLAKRQDRSRTAVPNYVKDEVMLRDGGACVVCGSKAELQFDHIIPYSLGGADTVQTLQILCGKCNRTKGAKLY